MRIVKVVSGDGAEFAPDTFPNVAVLCYVDDHLNDGTVEEVLVESLGTVTLIPGTPITVSAIPAPARCEVSEPEQGDEFWNGQTSWSTDPAEPVDVLPTRSQIVPPVETVTVDNVFDVGGFELGKVVVNPATDQDGAPIALTDEYEFTVVCTFLGDEVLNETVTLDAGGSEVFDGLPVGAECEVTESDAANAASTENSVTVGGGTPVTEEGAVAEFEIVAGEEPEVLVEFTNLYEVNGLEITKEITGSGAEQWGTGPFTIQVVCTLDFAETNPVYDAEHTVTPEEPTVTIGNLPSGAECEVTEPDTGGATDTSIDPSGPVTIGDADADAVIVTVTNVFETGGLQILKEVTGPGAPVLSDGPFVFEVICVYLEEEVISETVTLTGDGSGEPIESEPILGIPVGADCTVTEVDAGGADETPAPVTVMIPAEDPQTGPVTIVVGFVNTFSAATASIEKVIDGAAAEEDWATEAVFTVIATCELDIDGTRTTVYSGEYRIQGGEIVDLTHPDGSPVMLPLGSHCFIEETVTGGATAASVSHDGYDNALVVEEGDEVQVLELVATNTFEYAGFDVTKTVTGTGAAEGRAKTFEIVAVCVFDQGGEQPLTVLDETFPITHGETVTFESLPVGADCTVSESDAAGAVETKMTVSGGDAVTEAEFTLLEDESVSVEIENVFEAPMPATGFDASRLWVIGGIAAAVLALGGVLLLVSRRHRKDGADVSDD
ncbi:DUF5979 domain-containing protein [Microbacterium sp. NIBRBAC000506063]|uniref:DUF5979 domain-containing protein n=1 Tax=Microbacterium sp. NIBRBAC000506063 TaxID=2734618 RepID=UPI001BB4BEE4|nr:DUF5979 domain-containing protein [Microbacterium sp. NIBRBAC000506063]QTV80319.1 hypothetical protein KAE78_04935 [Microbacterium sp. NIBRBAC000506063]